MTENKPIIYYKKDCLNEPYCSLKEVLEELSHRTQECEELKKEIKACYNQVEDFDIIATSKSNKLKQAEQKLEKIEKIVKDFHYVIIPFRRGINHEMADRIDYYLNQMLQIIDEVE